MALSLGQVGEHDMLFQSSVDVLRHVTFTFNMKKRYSLQNFSSWMCLGVGVLISPLSVAAEWVSAAAPKNYASTLLNGTH